MESKTGDPAEVKEAKALAAKAKQKQTKETKGKVVQHRKPALESTLFEELVVGTAELGERVGEGLARLVEKKEINNDTKPWKEVLKEVMTKKERIKKIIEFKKAAKSEGKSAVNTNTNLKKLIVLGFKSVMKTVESGEVELVLVDSQLPQNLLRFLLPLCQSKGVRILGLQDLAGISRKIFSFRSNVICLLGGIREAGEPFPEIVSVASDTLVTAKGGGEADKKFTKFIYSETRIQ